MTVRAGAGGTLVAGGLVADADLRATGIVEQLGGAGSLTAGTLAVLQGSAVLPGAGAVAANSQVFSFTNPAVFAGTGSLAANSQIFSFTNPAVFAGVGALQSNTTALLSAVAAFAGVGDLAADATVESSTTDSASFAGVGALAATALLVGRVSPTFAGASTFSVDALVPSQFADLGGTGALAVAAAQRLHAAGTFAGLGNLSAASTFARQATAAFSGVGGLAIDAFRFHAVSAEAVLGGQSLMCVQTIVRLGPKGVTTNAVVAGVGPATNRIIQGGMF